MAKLAMREADVYVFALLAHTDKSTIDPLDLDQWQFFVLSRAAICARTRSQYSITLKSLDSLPGSGSVSLVPGSVGEGWVLNDETYLFTDAEIFGLVKQQRLVKRRPVARHKLFAEIQPGDYNKLEV